MIEFEPRTGAGSNISSVENIMQSGEGMSTHFDVEEGSVKEFEQVSKAGSGSGSEGILPVVGKECKEKGGMREGGISILKQTSYNVSYDEVERDDDMKRREMWLTRQLPKIPWEGQQMAMSVGEERDRFFLRET
jgi:hypothetical protein